MMDIESIKKQALENTTGNMVFTCKAVVQFADLALCAAKELEKLKESCEFKSEIMQSWQKIMDYQQKEIEYLRAKLRTAEQERDQYKANQVFDASRKKLIEDSGFSDVVELISAYESLRATQSDLLTELRDLREFKRAVEGQETSTVPDYVKAVIDAWNVNVSATAEYNAARDQIRRQNWGDYAGDVHIEFQAMNDAGNAYHAAVKAMIETASAMLASPVPAQQSPAVAVHDGLDVGFIEDCLIAYKSYLYFDGAEGLRNKIGEQIELLVQKSTSPRITEQDAREIVKQIACNVPEYINSYGFNWDDAWNSFIEDETRALLNKLSASPSPANPDCSGEPNECPSNEGHGCPCSKG